MRATDIYDDPELSPGGLKRQTEVDIHTFATHSLRAWCVTPAALRYAKDSAIVTRAINKFT